MIMHRNHQKKGLSNIIAAIFVIAIVVLGLNLLSWGLQLQNNYANVLVERSQKETQQSAEKIELRNVRIDSDKFNMTLVNAGSLPVKLVTLWVTNTTDTNGWHQKYDNLNKPINPGDSLTKFGQDLTLIAKSSSSYKFNIITERGTSTTFQILSPKDKAIAMSLFALPRSMPTLQNVTLLFSVTNNLTDGSLVQSITPNLKWPPDYTEAAQGTTPVSATIMEGPTPVSVSSLSLAQSAFFKWIIKVEGDAGDKIKFNATVANAKAGNYFTAPVDIVVDSFSEQSNTSLQSVSLSTSAPDNSGDLHLHGETAPYLTPTKYRLDPVFPDTPANISNLFDLDGEAMSWLTVNSTTPVTIASNTWRYILYVDKSTAQQATGILRINVTKVDVNGQWLQTIWASHTKSITSTSIMTLDFTMTSAAPAITLNAQERIMITLSREPNVGSGNFYVRYDSTQDSLLKTPTQTPNIATYSVYSSGTVKLTIKNTGSSPIWIDHETRIVFKKTTTGASYAGRISDWKNQTSGANPITDVITDLQDSPKLPPSKQLQFIFTEPVNIPGRIQASDNPSVTSDLGNYNAYVKLSGYDNSGNFVLRIVVVGIVVV